MVVQDQRQRKVMTTIGLWVWKPMPTASELARLYELGISRIYIKVSDGPYVYPGLQFIGQLCRAAGMETWGWGFIHGDEESWRTSWGSQSDDLHPVDYQQAEVTALDIGTRSLNADGLVLDAEGAWEQGGHERIAYHLLSQVRQPFSGPLWYSSFAFPRLHPAFPWAIFSDLTDGAMPQVFPAYTGLIWEQRPLLSRVQSAYSIVNDRPAYPLLEMFTEDGQPLDRAAWDAMLDEAQNLEHVSVFHYGLLGKDGEAAIRDFTGKPQMDEVLARLERIEQALLITKIMDAADAGVDIWGGVRGNQIAIKAIIEGLSLPPEIIEEWLGKPS